MAQSSHAGEYQASYRVRLQHGNVQSPLYNLHFLLNALDMEVSSATLNPDTQAWELGVTLDFSLPTPIQPVPKIYSFYTLDLS